MYENVTCSGNVQRREAIYHFDDPFINLDMDKTEGALQFLEEVSKEYQVIYFTCNDSRIRK